MPLKAEIKLPEHTQADGMDVFSRQLSEWNPEIRADSEAEGDVISIYEVIGKTWDGEGVTAKRVAAALREIGPKAVTVNINSPGGNYFDGVAIYNLLRQHPGHVTVNVVALAGSAASIIAMAGDTICIAKSAQLFIHNAWGVAIGNSREMQKASDDLAHLDASMVGVYADQTGLEAEKITEMMGKDTYLNGNEAVEMGFADKFMDHDTVEKKDAAAAMLPAMRKMEHALIKSGMKADERSQLMAGLYGEAQQPAANTPENDDGDIMAGIRQLIDTLKS